MSTVAELISRISPRIGDYNDLYWAINHAVRTIAKRLFILQSDIIKTEFTLTFDIEESSQDIASSYAGFWGLAGKPWVNGKSKPLSPVNDNSTILEYKPWVHDKNQGALSYSTNDFIDAGQDFSDYTDGNYIYKLVVTNDDATINWGYIGGNDGETTANIYQDREYETAGWLGTDPSAKTPSSYEIQTQVVGEPKYFELKNTTLHIYPCYYEEVIVYGDCFIKPTELSATTETIPFDELFDDVIEEYVVKIVRSGFTGADKKSDPGLLQYLTWQAVDEILAIRSQTQVRGLSG